MNGSRNASVLYDEDPLKQEHEPVEQHAKGGDEEHRHEHGGRIEGDLDLEHKVSEALVRAEELADDSPGDGEDGTDLHAGEDVRKRARQLDLGKELPARPLQRAHQVEELGLGLAQATRGREEDREYRDGKRHDRVRKHTVLEPYDDERP